MVSAKLDRGTFTISSVSSGSTTFVVAYAPPPGVPQAQEYRYLLATLLPGIAILGGLVATGARRLQVVSML